MKRATAIACLMWAIALAAGSCSGDGGAASAADAGPDHLSSPWDVADASSVALTTDAGSDAAAPIDLSGWPQLPGFDSSCAIYVAPHDKLPVQNAWEPCDARVHGVDGGALSCRQIADNWGAGGAPGLEPIGYVASAYVDRTTQTVTLPILRFTPNAALFIVADADGPVHQAIAATTSQCAFDTFVSVAAGDVAYEIIEMSPDLSTIVKAGAVGGPFGSPRVLRSYTNVNSLGYVAGANEFAEYGAAGFDTGSWIDGHKLDTLETSAPGQVQELQFQQDDLFFSVSDLTYGRVQHYGGDAGVTDFISFGNDTQSFAADFGTDGTDMVWSEAFGHPSDSAPWTTVNIETAPYTTNAASISKRRLLSETNTPGARKFTVGCGYAVHESYDATQTGVRIIRLSDGQSWLLANDSSTGLSWNDGVAITCSEVFINFNFGSGKTNLARIRLDSLGPGTPAN